MLSPRLTNCPECSNIPDLLKKINCKLAELGNSLYNNVSYMLNQPIPAGEMLQLIAYKRILTHKYCNPDYVYHYSIPMIASKVIRLTAGCVSRCNTPEPCIEIPCDITIVQNPTTTTTTTLVPTTTTTSTTCNNSTPHPYPSILIFGTESGNFSQSLIDACLAASCLQASTCFNQAMLLGNFNDAVPVIGSGFYAVSIGECVPPEITGYFVINLSGTYTVIQILNGYVQSYPTC